MIIDAHGHITAPIELYGYQAMNLASRGHHGKGDPHISDDMLEHALQPHLQGLKNVGTDVQFISPRPYTLIHSQPALISRWYIEHVNDLIARQVELHPDVFRGICGLPQSPLEGPDGCINELERCVLDLGFIGALLNPDPGEGLGSVPPLGDPYWYGLYAKFVELDVPAFVHPAGCQNERESYSNHFITEESIATLSLLESKVFEEFPTLKFLICHGGGSVPYQVGRWRAHSWRGGVESFDDQLRRLYFDTALYNKESLDLLFKIVGTDRSLFGTEKPGSGSAQDPATGLWLDDLKPIIEGIDWLTDQDKQQIFEDNARVVYPRFK